ncbi:hypothetical protein IM792_05290 [Mucilaginibacter sp. JRF]|uniref:hypothetical protein n=1 Tax=Mucilaginibacter sp. JRF TaxID=2780088 RepID=UPI00187F02A5|nr:hypothetical protein [Mucilaginibacter sp. JRF]MBE9583853.1 hypothetical protein [Mucilaginibacter sp. JRF]
MKNCCLALLLIIGTTLTASAQKWQAGSFTDSKGIRQTGFINPNPKGKSPVKEEAFIEYKLDDKMNPIKLSAGELRSFTIGRDSFVVAHAPGNTMWAGKEFDFVRVVLNEEIKLYTGKGAGKSGGFGIRPGLSGGFGMDSGGYGGVGGGVGISLGGNGNGDRQKIAYYFGANTAEMMMLTPINFNDIMSDIMGDEPEVVNLIQQNKFNLNNIDKLIEYFNKVKTSHQQQ